MSRVNKFQLRKIPFSGCPGHCDGYINPEGNKQIRERGVPVIVCQKFKQFHGFFNLGCGIGLTLSFAQVYFKGFRHSKLRHLTWKRNEMNNAKQHTFAITN